MAYILGGQIFRDFSGVLPEFVEERRVFIAVDDGEDETVVAGVAVADGTQLLEVFAGRDLERKMDG